LSRKFRWLLFSNPWKKPPLFFPGVGNTRVTFCDVSDEERARAALLKYCHLDTLALRSGKQPPLLEMFLFIPYI